MIGASLRTRATAALFKGLSLSVMAVWVFGLTIYQVFVLGVPSAEVMGVIGFLALAANLGSVLLLRPIKMATRMFDLSGSALAMTRSATLWLWLRLLECGAHRPHGLTWRLQHSWLVSSLHLRCKSSDRRGASITRENATLLRLPWGDR